MKTFRSRVSVMATVTALLMAGAGCVPVFRHALPLPESLIPDAALVESGRLAGTVQTNGQSVAVTVMATPGALLAALQAEGVEAFVGTADALIFHRMQAVTVP